MQLSPNFTLEEMTVSQTAVRRGLSNKPSATVIANLTHNAANMEDVKLILGGVAILVNSGYRSKAVNQAVGGSSTSAHVYGFATDFIAPRFGTPLEICHALVKSGIRFDQLIEEGAWVHISFDPRLRGRVTTFRNGKYTSGLRPLPKKKDSL